MDGDSSTGRPVPGVTEETDGAADEPFVSLYRRFRPGRFGDLRGQPHVVLALPSAVRDGHVAHAYLFSGPRGTGKTSTARILARALNCAAPLDGEPCGVCQSCVEIARGTSLDVHELDAASNNGVDAMRDLVSHAALGTPGRWKVYIIDEVHMLSTAAANALLKTLEEPPAHVVFVLATTDQQKVPATVRSRTQHFEFRLLGSETIEDLLRDVRSRAGLSLGDDALAVAVRRARGSARDALSALDQLAASGSLEDARPDLAELVEALCDEDAERLLVSVAALQETGWGAAQLAGEVVDDLRQAFLLALAPDLAMASGSERHRLSGQAERLGLARLVRAMETLGRAQVEMREAPDPRVVLEVALVRLVRPELDESSAALGDRLARLEQALAAGAGAPRLPALGPPPAVPPAPSGIPGEPGSQTTIGALRRQRLARGAPPPAIAPADPSGAPASAPVLAPVGGPPSAPAPPASAPAPLAGVPDRDSLVEAWGDHVLRGLPGKAKAFFSAGRFVDGAGDMACFALPTAAHRDRCEELRPVIESALAAHFGVAVPVRLVVDAAEPRGPAPARRPAKGTGGPPVGGPPPVLDEPVDLGDDDFDPDDPGQPLEMEALAQERLFEAFPGAREVSE